MLSIRINKTCKLELCVASQLANILTMIMLTLLIYKCAHVWKCGIKGSVGTSSNFVTNLRHMWQISPVSVQCKTNNKFLCCFPLGYEGPNCEIDIDECAEQPCENSGECFERSDPSHWELDWELSFADAAGYICQCQPGFAGQLN